MTIKIAGSEVISESDADTLLFLALSSDRSLVTECRRIIVAIADDDWDDISEAAQDFCAKVGI